MAASRYGLGVGVGIATFICGWLGFLCLSKPYSSSYVCLFSCGLVTVLLCFPSTAVIGWDTLVAGCKLSKVNFGCLKSRVQQPASLAENRYVCAILSRFFVPYIIQTFL